MHLADSPGQVSRHADARGLGRPATSRRSSTGCWRAVERGRPQPDWSAWVDDLPGHGRGAPAERDAELLSAEADPIHPARIYGELVPRLADDAVVIGDGGDFVSFAGKFVEPKRPGGWLDPGPYGCLGAGLGAAIAARLARPSAQVVLLLGDGAAGFSLMDVDTLVRHDLPVVMVMGNNSAWGLEKGPMQMLYGYDVVADLAPRTRTTRWSRPSAAAARRSPTRSEIGPALDRAFAAGVPYLVNVITDVERGLPAQHLRDLSGDVQVRRARARGATTRSGELTVAAYDDVHSTARTTTTSRACATPRARDREAELWVAESTTASCSAASPLPARARRGARSVATTRASSGCSPSRRRRAAAGSARRWSGVRGAGRASTARRAMVLSTLAEMTARAPDLRRGSASAATPERDWSPVPGVLPDSPPVPATTGARLSGGDA